MTNSTEKNILFLGRKDSPILEWLINHEKSVIQTSEKITPEFISVNKVEFIVSYGYRHIIKKNILDLFPASAINLHISYLPWNRGSDPNFWSFVESTPKGITIHYLDEGVDTGGIILQEKIEFNVDQETLATSYEKLQIAIQELFKKNWQDIKWKKIKGKNQLGLGSQHKVKDKEDVLHFIVDGWNTRLSVIEKYAEKMQMPQRFWAKYDAETEKKKRMK